MNSQAIPERSATVEADLVKKKWHVGTLSYTASGLGFLFFWLLWGDFAWNLKERAINSVAQVMLRGFTAPDWVVGLLVGSVPAAIGMVLGPIVSVKSDNHRGRWGRRIPFLLIPTPLIVLSMFGLAITPSLGSWLYGYLGDRAPSEMFCRMAAFGFFWTIFEISTITVNTLFGALINDVVPQVLLGRFFALFRVVSLLAGILFNYYLMGKAATHFFEIFIGLGLLYGIGFVLMCLNIKESDYPPPQSTTDRTTSRFIAPIISYFKECYGHSYYRWYFIAITLGALALGPVNTYSIFHGRSVGMSDGLYGKSLALSYFFSLLLAYPIGIVADRFHPLRIGIAALVLYCAGMFYSFFFATSTWTFFATFVMHTVVSGIYLTGTASIAQRLLPKSKFGQYSSAAGIVCAFCYGILPPALGLLIQYMSHDYRYVFLLGGVLSAVSIASYFIVLHKFKRLGGDKAYVAPLFKA